MVVGAARLRLRAKTLSAIDEGSEASSHRDAPQIVDGRVAWAASSAPSDFGAPPRASAQSDADPAADLAADAVPGRWTAAEEEASRVNLQLLLQAAAHGDRDAWAGLQQASELLSAVVWSHREVAAGVKHLSGDHTLTLADAIGQHAPLRVQLLGAFGGRLHSLEATFEVQYGQGRHLTASAAEYKAALLKSAKMEVAEHQPMLAAQRL